MNNDVKNKDQILYKPKNYYKNYDKYFFFKINSLCNVILLIYY